MKSWIPFLAFCLLALSSCTKSEIVTPAEAEAEVNFCGVTAEATVERMILNENGTEYFYYLRIDQSIISETMIFPKNLSTNYRVEGMTVAVEFGKLQTLHSYIVCLAGHQIDPANPDVRYMTMVDVCAIEETKS